MLLGTKVKKISEANGYDVPKLANETGITHATMYRILKKDSIESKYLEKIAEVLGISVLTFFDGAESNSSIQTKHQTTNTNQNTSIISSLQKLISNLERDIKELREDKSDLKKSNNILLNLIEQKVLLTPEPPLKVSGGTGLGKNKECPKPTVEPQNFAIAYGEKKLKQA